MKLLLYSDVHWAENSSIIHARGDKYSLRLENLISSVNCAEEIAEKFNCDGVVCLGDFFDRPNLSSEEITALKEIRWANMPHHFIVGNHDANINDLSFASTFVFNSSNFDIVTEPTLMVSNDINETCDIVLLPYIIESDRKTLKDYLNYLCTDNMTFKSTIVLSHNDIAGINYGSFISKVGFDVEDILDNCDLFINGHLHNCGFVDSQEKILNIGNLSGLNFSENAFIHRHYCAILDTKTLELQFFENPYAFNFYKINTTKNALDSIELGPNAVVSLQCKAEEVLDLKEQLAHNKNVILSRVQTIISSSEREDVDISALTDIDYIKQFSDYVLSHMDNTNILIEELTEILK